MKKHGLCLGAGFSPPFPTRRRSMILLLISQRLFLLLIFFPCRDNSKKKDVRIMNIEAAKSVADAVRTSLGPRGMDKMVREAQPLLYCPSTLIINAAYQTIKLLTSFELNKRA
jgi:hypothetical protein